MNLTFIEMIAQCKERNDKESTLFIEYIMLKYFNNNNFFMSIKEAVPFLDSMDLEILLPIIESNN